MKLTTEVVTKLVSLRAKKKQYETEEKALCEEIKEQMKEDKLEEFAPKDSPYMLQYQVVPTTLFSWEELATDLLKQVYGKRWKKILNREKKNAGKENRVKLLTPANPKYKGEK